MKRLILALLAVAWLAPAAAHAASTLVAEQVTPAKAAKYLFGGSDAVGGIGDWYLSNGKVQAIIDEIGTTTTTSGATVDLTSSQAVETGGTLVDLGLNGKNNDQIDQVFNTGGLSLANVFIFHQGDETPWPADPNISGALPPDSNPCVTLGNSNLHCALDVVADPSNAGCAAITVYGIMLGTCKPQSCVSSQCKTTKEVCATSADCPIIDYCSTRTSPKMLVRTTFKVCGSERAIHLHTEVWNQSGHAQTLPVFDVFLWGGRGLVPFATMAPIGVTPRGGGFTQPMLDLSSTDAVMKALTLAPFFAAPGNENPADGPMAHGKKVGTVSYGYYPNDSWIDSNGPVSGGTITDASGGGLASLQSTLLSAAAPFWLLEGKPTGVPNGGSVVVERTIVVGLKNDVASVVGDTPLNKDSIFEKSDLKSLLGTVKGSFTPAPTQEGTVMFIRTGGDELGADSGDPGNSVLDSAVMSEVRAKGSFKLLLPVGTYTLRAVFPGLPDIGPSSSPRAPTFTVSAGTTTAIPAIKVSKAGKLKVLVEDADTLKGMPAKISLSPSPRIRREFASFSYSLLTGMCSNDLSTECKADTDCGGSNVCFRTCSNVAPQPCAAVVPICPSGFTCASDNYCRKDGCSSDADCDPDSLCRADTTDALPESYPGGTAQLQVIYTDHNGMATAQVAPNTTDTPHYTVYVSRGLEYTIQKFDNVVITSGQLKDLGTVTLKRVVDTTGYMSADFHIHSGRSFDASAPLKARVNAFASEGLEVMVATDHDMNTDYMPIIKSLKMTPFLTSIIGTEVTTSVPRPPFMANMWGHINSWPSVYDQTARRNNSVEDEGVSINEVYDRLRNQPLKICMGGKNNGMSCETTSCGKGSVCTTVDEHVVQLNHPRAGVSGTVGIGMLANIGYDPSKAIDKCESYPVLCPSSQCAGGTNDGTSCTANSDCTGGGLCGCESASLPLMANGCNDILLDMNTIPQTTLCTDSSCGSSFKGSNNTRNIDFDTMEIDNGGSISGYENLIQSRRDWLSFLNQGILVGAQDKRHLLYGTGVSDSHRVVMELAGYSRTFVGAGDLPNPASVDVNTFNDAVMSGDMTATTGPFITFTAADHDNPTNTANMGETLGPSVSHVTLNVTVQAAPWVPVDEIRLIKNGCVEACYAPDIPNPELSDNQYDQTTTYVPRFTRTITEAVSGDSYYIVEAGQNLPAPSSTPVVDPVVNSVAAGAFVYGFSNPIFVDGDGDGKYTGISLPPGAGEPSSCPAPTGSCSAGVAIFASIPSSTMFARATVPQPEPGMLGRLWRTLVGPAVADERQARTPNPEDEERVRRHEREILKPSTERLLWNRIEFPTPAPTPGPEGSGH